MTQAELADFGGGSEDAGECGHGDTIEVATGGMHYEDGVDGEVVEWCKGCGSIVGREEL